MNVDAMIVNKIGNEGIFYDKGFSKFRNSNFLTNGVPRLSKNVIPRELLG